MRAPAAETLAARRARQEIDADGAAAPAAQRAHLAHLGHDTQQLLRRRNPLFHLGETVFTERNHPGGDGGVADLILGAARGNEAPELVGHPHHFVDPDAAAIPGVIALIAADRLVERNRRCMHNRRTSRCATTPMSAPAMT